MTAPTMQASPNDVNILVESPEVITLKSGLRVGFNRLRTRELMKLLRIVTHSSGSKLFNMDLDPDDPSFGVKLMTTVVLAIPDAEQETIEFIFAMAKPVGLIDKPKLSRQDSEKNLEMWTKLAEELENPNLFDLIKIVKTVIKQEIPDLKELGKEVKELWTELRPPTETQEEETAQEEEPSPNLIFLESLETNMTDPSSNSATSSPVNTDGPTTTSSAPITSVNFAKSPEQLFGDAT